MKIRWVVAAGVLACAQPALAQDATAMNVRFCGAGLQGEAEAFRQKNPNLGALYADSAFRAALYRDLLTRSDGSQWGVNLYDVNNEQGRGATLGLSHVLTYESVDRQQFRDPRDGLDYYNTTYAIGINTVLFDTADRQIRTIIPTVIMAANVTRSLPSAQEDLSQFRAILTGFDQPESAVNTWLTSITALPIRYDERSYLQVLPLELSDEARATLDAAAKAKGQSPSNFVRNATTQLEAMTAVAFGKPMVPVSLNADGRATESSQYLATMPECLGQTTALSLPPPSFQIRVALEKLLETSIEHRLPGADGASFQTELAYGGRYRTELAKFDSLNGATVLDSRTFRFQKSIRFSGRREISSYEQYFKLTSNFMKSVLNAYAAQDRNWVKASMSSAVTDKKQRDPAAVVKAWKAIVRDQMKVAPPTPRKERKDA